jgi:catechol 2,3-dioxygenase-like lactoylglutathione lyase family enzyme
MKRLHVHVAVDDLERSTAFYSTLFAAEPVVVEADYAKWMLDDPKVNFAISSRGRAGGIDHLGLQVETAEELAEIAARLKAANEGVVSETDAACCYARSDKEWAVDPQGVRWESFLTHGQITTYGEGSPFSKLETIGEAKAACCAPPAAAKPAEATAKTAGCCG